MELESLFGLPAHPLVVHAAVVLVPLAAIGTVLIALWASARRRIGWIVVGFAVLALAASWLAESSGEPLEEQVDETEAVEEHAELGESMPALAALMALGAGGVMVLDTVRRRREGDPAGWHKPAAVALSALAVIASTAGTVRVVQVGHSGAEATWEDVAEEGEGSESGEAPQQSEDEDEDEDD